MARPSEREAGQTNARCDVSGGREPSCAGGVQEEAAADRDYQQRREQEKGEEPFKNVLEDVRHREGSDLLRSLVSEVQKKQELEMARRYVRLMVSRRRRVDAERPAKA